MPENVLVFLFASFNRLPRVLLYAGPDQLIPIASFLAAIIGFLLIGWQRFVSLLRKVVQAVFHKLRPSSGR